MSIPESQLSTNQFMTRLAFAYEYKIPYSIVVDRVRRGELALHYVDGRVMINIEKALKACERKRPSHRAKVVTVSVSESKSDLFA
jgi:hypothetical protein